MSKQDRKIIAVDFDGLFVENEWPNIGEPIMKNINRIKDEIAKGARVILWTSRIGVEIQAAVDFCDKYGIRLEAVNENLPDVIKTFGGDPRKIYANEYWDDKAVYMSEKDIGEFSDGFHTFNDLYEQRLYLSASLFNVYKERAWKSWRHSDGELCFDGECFIVGIETPLGHYTYHYKNDWWGIFDCKELETAPEWDGHTHKNVDRLMSLSTDNYWIPVEQRLPHEPDYEWVLVKHRMNPKTKFRIPHIARFRNGIWYADCFNEPLEGVTHWAPLPGAVICKKG